MARKRIQSGGRFHDRLLAAGRWIVFLGVLLAVALSSAYMGMRLAVRGSEVEVPAVMGVTLGDASKRLAELGLRPEVIGERFDAVIPRGAVISQHPQPGRSIKVHGAVQVIVSRGEKADPVPDLIHSSLRVARLLVAQSGFELGLITEASIEGVPEGQIVRQYPEPHSKDFISPRVDILLSRGEKSRYVMPDVTGQGVNSVLRFFEKNGFKAGSIQYIDYAGVSRGTVVRQFPEPGYLLTEGESVNLRVAR